MAYSAARSVKFVGNPEAVDGWGFLPVRNDPPTDFGMLQDATRIEWGHRNRRAWHPDRVCFTIRLGDSGDLLGTILKNHDKFPDELKAEVPLKRIWAPVLEE